MFRILTFKAKNLRLFCSVSSRLVDPKRRDENHTTICPYDITSEVDAQMKNFNAQAQIAKFLIDKTQAQISQVKNNIEKAQEKNKIRKAQAQIAQLFQKFNKAQIAQKLKKNR